MELKRGGKMKKDGLEKGVEKYIGKILVVEPIYGNGWYYRKAKGIEEEPFPVPPKFKIRLKELWEYEGIIRGGVGIIEDESYEYNSFWVIFATSFVGIFNFEDKIGSYGFQYCPEKYTFGENGWPVFKSGYPNIGGYAKIHA